MASIRVRKETGFLFIDFRFRNRRCREYTELTDTQVNRRRLHKVLDRISAELKVGTFDYVRYFPNSPMVTLFSAIDETIAPEESPKEVFSSYAKNWFDVNKVEWKRSYQKTVGSNINTHLIPYYGESPVNLITKSDIKRFRLDLAEQTRPSGKRLSHDRINHIMTTLRQIMAEASDDLGFNNPFTGIKPLKIPKPLIEPFSISEVNQIIANVREDFRDYYIVRFFSGMRTGEIDGLKWIYVDFDRREIHIQETIVNGNEDTPKCPQSYRTLTMTTQVHEALQRQYKKSKDKSIYVFCNANGEPLDHRNVTKRVWYPLLRRIGIKPRRPYQTRHTAACLWLGSGENPEWISRQLGHSDTRMLFERYSRFVPNLTRQDGAAIERLLQTHFNNISDKGDSHD